MDQETFNISIRKFLKMVGVNSQREIEQAVQKAMMNGRLQGNETVPAQVTLEPGTRLDRYELLCVLAHGGMANVWLARIQGKMGFERLFAVKEQMEMAEARRLQP